MKTLLPSVLLGLLAVTPAAGQPSPRVCLASVDDKGNVRIRSFTGLPVMERTAKVAVDAGGGKREERPVKVSVRFAVEHILTISIKGLDGYIDGQPVDENKLRELLAKETPVLVATQKPSAAVQKALKKGALLLISPVSPESPGAYVPLPAPQ